MVAVWVDHYANYIIANKVPLSREEQVVLESVTKKVKNKSVEMRDIKDEMYWLLDELDTKVTKIRMAIRDVTTF